MKKSKLLASVALASMIVGSQVALADHTKEHKAEEKEKNSCKGKEKNSCKGKEGKMEGKNACSGNNGCDGKMHEHPAAPAKPEKKQ
ncbi:MAG: hypothetical protein ACJ76H_12265 [Bacteriovoracaceae bacterium]